MQQTGVMPAGYAQLLKPAVEDYRATDAEDIVAGLDDLTHAAGGHQIAGLRQIARRLSG
jgi:hypothetical protein